ncbi:hypothetical protein ANANG_G00272920 [Anguilla anguilla]|uniref:Ubiquitin carboxyl-terminal hydrolase 40 ubiquitin-like domain-containing protein n=1 Tax=Anguilla anguilla TaxID=7936 RepID=A0A9D3LMD2_ANGAN|nr:hypothetical protein ANANG_G00272920 [Anguilla anguilla]
MHRTLKELALRDGDALLVLEPQALDTSIISVSGDIVTVTTPSDCRWLLVEFCPRGGRGAAGEEEQDEGERRRGKVPASGNMLLLEVKQRAMEVLQLQDQLQDVKCCLRQVDSTGRLLPPVCEHLSVREAGVKLMTSLLLCPGEAPGPTQLFLYYTVGSDSPAAAERELTVEETLTVKECLKLIVKLAGLEGEAWHLRKTDWCEEVGDALTEEDATLAELRIHSGDTLVLTEGRLPPKGFLKLPVWLYGQQSERYVSQEAQGNHVTNGVEGDPAAVTGAEFRFAGQVEISGEASLDDLKTQVMTLPSLQDVCVPAPPFLRVWVLEGRRLSKILRGNQLPLKNLKLGSGTELCVQQLLKEENLGPKELVLRVQMGYGVSPDCLHIAKHLPEKHAWMAISNWSQQVSKRKKKKRAESLQGAPFHLKDGDLIGGSNRDFCTLRDVLGQQRLRQEAESRRKGGPNMRAEPSQGRDQSGRSQGNAGSQRWPCQST